jgi:uncharacterized protein (DUF58 family)
MADQILAWLDARLRLLVFCSLTVVAYVAAISRNQIMPWVIAALMLAGVVVGVIWPRLLVRSLSVTRLAPDRAEEGETIRLEITVANHGFLPRFMIELVDRLPFIEATHCEFVSREHTIGVISYVPGGATRQIAIPVTCAKRGFYRLGPMDIASGFPLGLVRARQRRESVTRTLTVYPDIFPILELPLQGAPSQIHRGGYLLPEGVGAAEFSGLREYRRGDSPRHIHWPSSARHNELMVKEYEPLASACLCIALDMSADGNLGGGKESTFEYSIRIAGSIARHGCERKLRTRMLGEGKVRLDISAGSGQTQYQTILDTLAVIEADGDLPYARMIHRIAPQAVAGETVVVFLNTAGSRFAETLQALGMLRARRVHLLSILFDAKSFGGSGKITSDQEGALLALGGRCIHVRRGDSLLRTFNP